MLDTKTLLWVYVVGNPSMKTVNIYRLYYKLLLSYTSVSVSTREIIQSETKKELFVDSSNLRQGEHISSIHNSFNQSVTRDLAKLFNPRQGGKPHEINYSIIRDNGNFTNSFNL